jgi:hypothetical protein
LTQEHAKQPAQDDIDRRAWQVLRGGWGNYPKDRITKVVGVVSKLFGGKWSTPAAAAVLATVAQWNTVKQPIEFAVACAKGNGFATTKQYEHYLREGQRFMDAVEADVRASQAVPV